MTEATDYLRPAQVGEIMGWSRSESPLTRLSIYMPACDSGPVFSAGLPPDIDAHNMAYIRLTIHL